MTIPDAPGTQALTVWSVPGRDASRPSLWDVAQAVLADHRPAAIVDVGAGDVPIGIADGRAMTFATATRRVTLFEAAPSAAFIDASISGELRFDAVIATLEVGAGSRGGGANIDSAASLRPALLIARQLGIGVAVIAFDGDIVPDAPREHREHRAERIGSVALVDDDFGDDDSLDDDDRADRPTSTAAASDDHGDARARELEHEHARESDIRNLLNAHGFDGDDTPIVRVSLDGALAGDGAALESLATLAAAVAVNVAAPEVGRGGPLFLPIESVDTTPTLAALFDDESVAPPARDAVVSGRIERGHLRQGDDVEVVGFGETQLVNVTGVAAGGVLVTEARAGEAVSVVLHGVTADGIQPGHVIAETGSARPHLQFEADVWLVPDGGGQVAETLEGRHDVSVLGTTVGSTISLADGAVTDADGATLRIHADLDLAVAVDVDQTFVLRRDGDIVGTGQVTAILDDGR